VVDKRGRRLGWRLRIRAAAARGRHRPVTFLEGINFANAKSSRLLCAVSTALSTRPHAFYLKQSRRYKCVGIFNIKGSGIAYYLLLWLLAIGIIIFCYLCLRNYPQIMDKYLYFLCYNGQWVFKNNLNRRITTLHRP
jgi:hypothetical protein